MRLLAMSTSVVCAQSTPGQKPAAQPAGGQNGLNTTQQKASYAIGIGVAESIKSDQLDLDQAALIKGITDGMNGVKPPLSDQEMSEAVQQFQKDQVAKISDKNKKEGAKFLAENKTKEGVKTTPSGLQYKVIKSGSGATPGPTDEVTAHYKGTLLDGKVFDSSYDRGQPIHLRRQSDQGLVGGDANDEGGRQVATVHPLRAGLWGRGRRQHDRSECRAGVRRRIARREKRRGRQPAATATAEFVEVMATRLSVSFSLFAFCLLLCGSAAGQSKTNFDEARRRMVEDEIVGGGVTNKRVIQAMLATPRHEFVSHDQQKNAYYDMSIPIGEGQTISGPFVVAYMTQELDPQPSDKVLEIGTGSGYQAAVLSPLVKDVYTIEILQSLGKRADATLKRLKYGNVHVKIGDGYQGLARASAVRQDHRHLLAGESAGAAGRRTQRRRPHDCSGRRALRADALSVHQEKRQAGVGIAAPDAVRADDRPGRAGARSAAGSAASQNRQRELRRVGGAENEPRAWFYCREMKVSDAADAPDKQHYLVFTNDVPGRMSRALQGFAIDGSKVGQLEVSAMIRGHDIRPGQAVDELPEISLTFYDNNSGIIGRTFAGPFRGTFDWKRVTEKLKVPAKATKCIMHVGSVGGRRRIRDRRCFDQARPALSAALPIAAATE